MIKPDLKSKEKYDEEQEQENVVRYISHISKEYFCCIFYSSSGSGYSG
jgi:hypothetical protein